MNHATNSTTTETGSLDQLRELMQRIREAYPPSQMAVKVVMPRSVWFCLREQVQAKELTQVPAEWPMRIEGIPIELDEGIPANCYSMEYADGHAVMVTPFGYFQWRNDRG